MAEETETSQTREIDDGGRVRTPMSPATWTADEQPAVQPGVVQAEPKPETKPEPTPEPPAPKPKKAA
jgi:hypothetical protein